jgi:hypothetical protein
MNTINQDVYKEKYLKYKNKYYELKRQMKGGDFGTVLTSNGPKTGFYFGKNDAAAVVNLAALGVGAVGAVASTAAYAPVNLKRMITCPWTTSGKDDKRIKMTNWLSHDKIKNNKDFYPIVHILHEYKEKNPQYLETIKNATKFVGSNLTIHYLKSTLQEMKKGADSETMDLLNNIIGNLDCLCNERGVTFTGTTAQGFTSMLGDSSEGGKVDLRCLSQLIQNLPPKNPEYGKDLYSYGGRMAPSKPIGGLSDVDTKLESDQ